MISQSPTGGSTANKDSTVTIVVGRFTGSSSSTSTSTTTTSTSTTHHLDHLGLEAGQEEMSPVRVAVLSGGRSSEHEVSVASAASVADGLRTAGYAVTVIEISRDGDVADRRRAGRR